MALRSGARTTIWIAAAFATARAVGQTAWPTPVDVELDRGACRGILNAHECSRIIETSQVKAAAGQVTRQGERLCFRTSTSEVCMADEAAGEGEQDKLFSYLGTLSRPSYHVVRVQYYEGSAVMLVNAATGTRQVVDALPVASPDGRYLAVSSADLGAAYNPNRLSVWAVVGDALESEWSIHPDTWMPGAVRWLDATTFEAPRVATDSKTGEERTIDTIVVQRDGAGWRLMSQKPQPTRAPEPNSRP